MTTGASKKPAAPKKTAAKKPAAKKAAPKKNTATKKAQPAKPIKMGATRSAAATSSEFKDRAISKAKSVASDGKARTSDAIEGLSKMIENSAATLDDNVGAKYGDYARSAADAVADFADKLNDKDVEAIVEDAREFVKKSPAVAIGAAAAIGFVVARLIKSGSDKDEDA